MLNVAEFSKNYSVKKLTPRDVCKIFNLCRKNQLYYRYCPPFVSKESIIADMQALPPNKTNSDKYYVGYFYKSKLIAVLDLITAFPNLTTVFIGFFMIKNEMQGKGIGSNIISELCNKLKELGFLNVRLGFVRGNVQSEKFWLKNGFLKIVACSKVLTYDVVYVEKQL